MAKKPATKTVAVTNPLGNVTLADIVNSGPNGTYAPESVFAPLVEQGLAEINTAMVDEHGNVAVRATTQGHQNIMAQTKEYQPVEVQKTSAQSKANFALESNIPIPNITGRGRSGSSAFPFDEMEVGHSFFVPNDEKRVDAAKSLASTVSSAIARYAEPSQDGAMKTAKDGSQVPVMVPTRKFIVRSVTENGVVGARVWRSQ